MNIPNFDAMDKDELMTFWFKYAHATRVQAEDLVGDRRKGFTVIAKQVANYAANKGAAVSCRLKGDIVGAQIYESICDSIYDSLPADLRW